MQTIHSDSLALECRYPNQPDSEIVCWICSAGQRALQHRASLRGIRGANQSANFIFSGWIAGAGVWLSQQSYLPLISEIVSQSSKAGQCSWDLGACWQTAIRSGITPPPIRSG